jgi:hypothetical protein
MRLKVNWLTHKQYFLTLSMLMFYLNNIVKCQYMSVVTCRYAVSLWDILRLCQYLDDRASNDDRWIGRDVKRNRRGLLQALSLQLSGGTGRNREGPQSGNSMSRRTIEPNTLTYLLTELYGTKWLLWRPHRQGPTLHSKCGINKRLI